MNGKTMRNAENNFITLLNFIVDPAVIVDEKGLFLVVNDAFVDLTGLKETELVGTPFLNLPVLSAKNKAILLKNLAKRMKGANVEPYEIGFKNRSDQTRYAEVKAKKIDYSGQPADLVVFRDITRRKANAKRLKEYSEKMASLVDKKAREVIEGKEKLEKIFDSSPDAIVVTDLNGKITEANEATMKIYGCSSKEDLIGKSAFEMIAKKEHPKLLLLMETILKDGAVNNAEYLFLNEEGKEYAVEISASFIKDQADNPIGFVAVYKDVTERKKAEVALRESEKNYRAIINAMNDTAWVIGFDGMFIDVNDAAVKALGYTREELLSMGPKDLSINMPEEDIEALIANMPKDEIQVFEAVHFTKDRKPIPVEISSSLVTYQGKQAILSIARNISERKKAEEKILASERKHRQLFEELKLADKQLLAERNRIQNYLDIAEVMLVALDVKGRVTLLNRKGCEILKCTTEEAVGKSWFDNFLPEKIRNKVKKYFKSEVSGKVDFPKYNENPVLAKNGDIRLIGWHNTVLRDQNGRIIGTLSSGEDITEWTKAQKALIDSEEKFRGIVENSNDVVMLTLPNGIVSYMSPACYRVLGYKPEDIVGTRPAIFHPDDAKPVHKTLLGALKGEKGSDFEYRIITKAGKTRWISHSWSPILEKGKVKLIVSMIRGIDERKQLEKSLRESEEMFRGISTSASDAIILLDEKDKVVYWNTAAEKIFGYTKDEVIGKEHNKLVVPLQHRRAHLELLKKVSEPEAQFSEILEVPALRKDGTEFPIELTVSALKLKGTQCMLEIIRDVSERKQMETQLREAENRYRALFDKAPLGIVLIDPETARPVEFNKEAHQQLGYTREEYAKLSVFDHEGLETPEQTKAHIKQMVREGRAEFETKHLTKNGEVKDIINTVQIIEIAGKKLAHVISRDVTEKKKTERELKIEKDKLEAVTENIGAGVAIISKDYNILWANKLLKQIHGECEGKMCYSTFNRLAEVCPNCGVKKVFEDGAPIDVHEYSNLDPKGNRFWIELIVTPIKDENGQVIAALELAVNITERKIMENKLAEYSQKLEKLVEQRTDQLEEAQAKLVKSERLAAIGELAAMVGHDLRNPLTGIMGAAYYLKTKHTSELGAKAEEMLETIEKAIKYSNKIVNDLLEYSRDLKLELAETTPKGLLENAMSLIEVPKTAKVVDATKDQPTFKADVEKLRRVFVNIIRNAFDAMPEGGTLTVKSRKVKSQLEISFNDTGTGMSKETLSKVKGGVPLFTTKAKGMGFGVPICKRVVEAHGGKISVESEVGKGTTITLVIPVKPKQTSESEPKFIFNESMLQKIVAKQKTK